MSKGIIHQEDGALTVTVPMSFKKRGGRKLVISPAGARAWAPPRARVDNAMVKALARAHRWQKLLDAGRYQTVRDLAEAENINPSYVARVLRLTLLSPDIVEAILNGQSAGLQLDDLLSPFPVEWDWQQHAFRISLSAGGSQFCPRILQSPEFDSINRHTESRQ